MLDAMRRMQATSATPPAFSQPADHGETPSEGTDAAATKLAASAREAAQSLLTAQAGSTPRTSHQRAWWLAAGAAALLLPMGGWLAWMMWEDAQPSTAVTLPAPAPVAAPAAAAPEATEQNQAPAQPGQSQTTVSAEAPQGVGASASPTAQKPPPSSQTNSPAGRALPPAPPKAAKTKPAPAVADANPSTGADDRLARAKSAPAPVDSPRKVAALPSSTSEAPAAPPLVVRSEANRQLQDAWTALGQGDAARALELYRQVLVARPDDPDATLGVAVALHRQKKLNEAWTAYQHSLKLWPDNATARTGLLAILSESDAATAESRLAEWVQSRPLDASAQAALGHLLGRQGRWAEALPHLARAQSLEPTQAAHAYNLAVALDQVRRYAEAARHYQMALRLGGVGVPVEQVKNRLQELSELGEP